MTHVENAGVIFGQRVRCGYIARISIFVSHVKIHGDLPFLCPAHKVLIPCPSLSPAFSFPSSPHSPLFSGVPSFQSIQLRSPEHVYARVCLTPFQLLHGLCFRPFEKFTLFTFVCHAIQGMFWQGCRRILDVETGPR